MDNLTKICNYCNIEKNIDKYYKGRNYCKDCGKLKRLCEHKIIKSKCEECVKNKQLINKNIKICNMCNIEKNIDDYYKRTGCCKICYNLKSKCKHNIQKQYCKECGGSAFCIHNKRKIICKECNGSQLCEHNISKANCQLCKGSSICKHNKQKSKCLKCGGSSICQHNKEKYNCIECKGKGICEHKKQKSTCVDCKGSQICNHNIRKSLCKECGGSQICKHNICKSQCKICTPDSKRYCIECKLFRVTKKNNYLCSYCNPTQAKYIKTKELTLKSWLENQNYKLTYNKKCNIDNSCKTYFPDFLIDCNTFFIVLECDENKHSGYEYNCERIRENNICYALGLPCIFIRYNPDSISRNKKINNKSRMIILKSYIEYYKTLEYSDNDLKFLFYN